jgi:hypothetical protein
MHRIASLELIMNASWHGVFRRSPAALVARVSKLRLALLFPAVLRSRRAPRCQTGISGWQTVREFEVSREPVKHKMQTNS